MPKKTIYAIDDERVAGRVIKDALEKAGFDIMIFISVNAALEHMGWSQDNPVLTKNLPDAIVTDYDTKTSKNGLDLIELAQPLNIPCVLLTGNNITPAAVAARGGNNARFMGKPVSLNAVVATLHNMLNDNEISR